MLHQAIRTVWPADLEFRSALDRESWEARQRLLETSDEFPELVQRWAFKGVGTGQTSASRAILDALRRELSAAARHPDPEGIHYSTEAAWSRAAAAIDAALHAVKRER